MTAPPMSAELVRCRQLRAPQPGPGRRRGHPALR